MNAGGLKKRSSLVSTDKNGVIQSAGFFSKTSECDALVQNGVFFMELDAAAIMENINKDINSNVIGAKKEIGNLHWFTKGRLDYIKSPLTQILRRFFISKK